MPRVDLQQLIDGGFNGFGIQLLIESYRRFKDWKTFGPFAFSFNGVRVVLEPDPQSDGRAHYDEGEYPHTLDDVVNRIPKLEAENERLQHWIDDLQSGMYINCAFCGHRFGPAMSPPTKQEVLHEHIRHCPEAPVLRAPYGAKRRRGFAGRAAVIVWWSSDVDHSWKGKVGDGARERAYQVVRREAVSINELESPADPAWVRRMRATWQLWRQKAERRHPNPYPQERCWYCPEPIQEDEAPVLLWKRSDPERMFALHPGCFMRWLMNPLEK